MRKTGPPRFWVLTEKARMPVVVVVEEEARTVAVVIAMVEEEEEEGVMVKRALVSLKEAAVSYNGSDDKKCAILEMLNVN